MKRSSRSSAAAASVLALALGGMALGGCASANAPPPRVEVPPVPGGEPRVERDPVRPVPGRDADEDLARAPFDDVPLVTQSPPEQRAYLRAYEDVGRPTMVVSVDRAGGEGAANGASSEGGSPAPVFAIDYDAIENVLTDWFAADGQVDVLSPRAAAGDQQKNAAARGDVLIEVRLRTTEQAGRSLHLRMVAEALNASDGRSLGRAVVDVPAPLDKQTINKYTRYMARKLMDGLIASWQRMAADAPAGARDGRPGASPPTAGPGPSAEPVRREAMPVAPSTRPADAAPLVPPERSPEESPDAPRDLTAPEAPQRQ